MHRRIGLLALAAVIGASTTTALAATGTAANSADRQAVTRTSDVLKAAASVDHGTVVQRIAAAAQVTGATTRGVSATAIATNTQHVRFAAVSVAGLSGAARQTATRWNALVANGDVAAAQLQVSNDAARVAQAVTTMRPTSVAAGGIVPCTVDTADTVLLVAFFVEVDAVFIPQDCGATNISCIKTNETSAIEAQEFLTVLLLEADINCYLFG